MNHIEAISFLNSFTNFESQLHQLHAEDFSLLRIKKFLNLVGHPDGNLKVIHVAGTKGKGSTCVFLASILQEAGFSVGLYTSPHLHRINERIRILSKDNLRSKDNFSGAISDDDFAAILNELRPVTAAIQNTGTVLTYFEVLTVLALCYFSRRGVDFVILETGLGGRLDATNAVESLVAVLTPVSLDHTKILGTKLSQIAFEKSGIIKNSHQKVVIAPQEKEVMDVFLGRCREFGIKPVEVIPSNQEQIKPSLKGKHQALNAATAIETAEVLRTMGYDIKDQAIHEGLKHVRWAGRFEVLQHNPELIVDCAHNAASAQALAQTLKENYPFLRVILVLGISEDKDVKAICEHLKDAASHFILTKANHPRSHSFNEAEGRENLRPKPFEIIDSLPKALDKAQAMAQAKDVILVTGSVFLVAQAMDYLCTNTKV